MRWFWVLMFLVEVIPPIVFIYFGHRFRSCPPKNISNTFGYRTRMSSINSDTWEFSHRLLGKIWIFVGVGLFLLSSILMINLFNEDFQRVGVLGGILSCCQIIIILLSCIPVECALRRRFDSKGIRR